MDLPTIQGKAQAIAEKLKAAHAAHPDSQSLDELHEAMLDGYNTLNAQPEANGQLQPLDGGPKGQPE
jgi:hypothetical protein